MFRSIYDACIKWAEHKHAKLILMFVSFTESIFFPIPPDVILAPMMLANPKSAWRLALLATVASVVGGAFGYMLGAYLFEPLVLPFIESMSYEEKFASITAYFEEYGILLVFLAAFTPIPYKLVALAAGMLFMPIFPFLLVSALGRGGRFFIIATIINFGGERMERKIREYVEVFGLVFVFMAAFFILYKANI